ncbi:amidohydrolase, partial [Dickeya undicola]
MRSIPEDIIQQAIIWRRDIHARPEIGLQEFNTSAKISSLLREYDLE